MRLPDPESPAELSIRAEAGAVRDASAWLAGAGRERSVPAPEAARLETCLNEVLANILDHGDAAALAAPIRLQLGVRHERQAGAATVTVSDSGSAFDPLTVAAPPRPGSLAAAEPGGLGLVMLRRFSDSLNYRRGDGCNHLSFVVRWAAEATPEPAMRHIPFRRGSERRSGEGPAEAARRAGDRRSRGLGWITLFRDAAEAEVDVALGDCEVAVLPAGTPLLRPGEANHSVYIVLAGDVAAYLDDGLRPEAAIAIAPGECVGEMSAIDGKPVSALVLALSEARVLKLTREVFWTRLMALPGVAGNLMVTLTERMRRSNEQALKAQREQLELLHLRKELDVARQLQIGMLPLQRPLFPDRRDIEVCGFMEPASKVGGDLFDAFFVDDRHLFFCIGDVSGHGIAAALFMARTIGLLRILAMNTKEPAGLLEALNERLCVGNETNLFVTLFCGFLDVACGGLRYSNGGHCAPILLERGQAERLPIPKGSLVGVFPGKRFLAMDRTLAPGAILYCYTDGVTEAQNRRGEEYSEERCIAALGGAQAPDLAALLDAQRSELARFTGTGLLEDDCTMLALRRPAAGGTG